MSPVPTLLSSPATGALHAAIRSGDLATVIDLLRAEAPVNGPDPEGLTPLMIASGVGQSQMVALLLTAGAEVRAVEPRMGVTALHKAAQSGNAEQTVAQAALRY